MNRGSALLTSECVVGIIEAALMQNVRPPSTKSVAAELSEFLESSAAVPLNVFFFLLFGVAVVMSAASPLSQCVVLCYVVLCCVVL